MRFMTSEMHAADRRIMYEKPSEEIKVTYSVWLVMLEESGFYNFRELVSQASVCG